MAVSHQQQSRTRKLIYFALIVALFTTTLMLRRHVVEVKAQELALREQNLGEVEVTGSALYLSLTGSRGMVVCYLWYLAQNMQMKNEWNELELVVNSLTHLQPHFIRPWVFQSWNLSYNVSVECDRVRDKYFYVTRGLDMLARGERRNHDNPDLRKEIGWFYQNKLGLADEAHTFRSLFQMSCIDPLERDPRRFRRRGSQDNGVHFEEFKTFCENHPILIRRLREKLRYDKPETIIDFLDDNSRLPSLYGATRATGLAKTPLKPLEDRFPILPPPSHFDPKDLNYLDSPTLTDDIDNFDLARTWFGYSQDPVFDPKVNRKPRDISTIVFLGYPARAQAYHAERLLQEGWIDEEGWTIRDWFPRPGSPRDKEPMTVGKGRNWAGEAWAKTFDLYERHGRTNGLLHSPEEIRHMSEQELAMYQYNLRITNFNHFYHQARVERTREAVKARKQFYKAEQARGSPREALRLYRDPAAFGEPITWSKPTGWKKIFLDNPEFRRDLDIQQETYEIQLKYLELERELSGCLGEQLRDLICLQNVFNHAASWPMTATFMQPAWLVAPGFAAPLKGPFDDVFEEVVEGERRMVPLISQSVLDRIRGQEKPAPSQRPGPTAK